MKITNKAQQKMGRLFLRPHFSSLPIKLASVFASLAACCFLFARFLVLVLLSLRATFTLLSAGSGVAISLFVLTALPLYRSTADLWASDMKAKLNGTANTNQFQILDNTGKVVGWIDAQGNAVFIGSATAMGAGIRTSALTSTGDVTVQGAAVLSTTTISNSSFTVSGGSGDAIVIRNGGDLKIFNADNGGSAVMYVDRNAEIGISNNLTVVGTAAVQGTPGLRVSSSVYLGAAQIDRYISDDSTRGETRFSSSVAIMGDLRVFGKIRGTIISSATYVGGWTNCTSCNDPNFEAVGSAAVTINLPERGVVFGFWSFNGQDNDAGFFKGGLSIDNCSTIFGRGGSDHMVLGGNNKAITTSGVGMTAAGPGNVTVKLCRSGDATATNQMGSQYHNLAVMAWTTP